MSSIKHTTISSLKWSTLEKTGQFSIQLIISIVLARLLGPDEYAIIGILNIFIGIFSVLVDAGFSQGLIRKQYCSHDDYNSVFWFNLFMSLLLYMVLFFSMPFIAKLFNDENLLLPGRVLILILPLQALNVVQMTIVNKELKFKKIAGYTLVATPIAGIVGIIMAYNGYGVWALVTQTLLYTSLIVILFWIKSNWKPTFNLKMKPIVELLGFSFKLSVASFLNAIFNNIYAVIVAKLYPKAQFGYFSQAQKYATMPTNLLESILNRMTYPILATLQDNMAQYREVYRKMQMIMFAFILPLMLGFILCGRESIILILGSKWTPSVLFFQILCIGGITLPFHPFAMSTLKVFGKSNIILNLEILKKVLIVLSIICSLSWGIVGLICGQTVYLWIVLLINLYYSGKQIKYSLNEQFIDIYPYFLIALVAAFISLILTCFINSMLSILIFRFVFFVGVYFLLIVIIKVPQFFVFQSLIKSKLRWL